MMKKKNSKTLNYIIPVIALIVIGLQVFMVETNQLSKWKGGGFGMYTEVHYVRNEIWVNDVNISLDSIVENNTEVSLAVNQLKLTPSKKALYEAAEIIQPHFKTDTLKIQVWKPNIDISKSTYSRELINEITYIK
jgi:hypothetical protein